MEKGSFDVPPVFTLLQKKGGVEEEMMYNTYNMGLGMVLAADPQDEDKIMEVLRKAGEVPYVVGKCRAGEKGVILC